jgi:hypothetical protein
MNRAVTFTAIILLGCISGDYDALAKGKVETVGDMEPYCSAMINKKKGMKTNDYLKGTYCFGVIAGAITTINVLQYYKKLTCAKKIAAGTGMKKFIKWVGSNKDVRDSPFKMEVSHVMMSLMGCKYR